VIFERYNGPLLAHCRGIVGDAAAQDAVQQAFMSAWHALSRGREVRQLRPWLFMIAHRAALEPLRRETSTEQLTEAHADGRSPPELIEQSARARATLAVLAELPPRERDALVWTSLHGRSGRETARALGISEGAVRQLVVRARARARAAVGALVPPVLIARIPGPRPPLRLATLAHGPLGSPGALEGAQALAWLTPMLAAGVLVGAGVSAVQPAAHRHAGTARRAASGGPGARPTGAGPRRPARPAARPRRGVAAIPAPRRRARTPGPGAQAPPSHGHPIAPTVSAPDPGQPSHAEERDGSTVARITGLAPRPLAPPQQLAGSAGSLSTLPPGGPPAEVTVSELARHPVAAADAATGTGQGLVSGSVAAAAQQPASVL
jgi:RNA polymerase sigma-70 factor (ECF subfamily)